MSVSHLSPMDDKYEMPLARVMTKKCPKCYAEYSEYAGSLEILRCPADQTMLVSHSVMSHEKVAEIKNRKIVKDAAYYEDKNRKFSLDEAWDEGLIERNIKATIYSVSGSGKIEVQGKMNKHMYLDKVVKIDGGFYRLSDIGAALQRML